ncbi:MAG: DUF4349 domain-containing protein [Caldisericia bacterium]|nr:DUF4349 domain-containing protein [Caldisericia bacterium]MDD4615291.1 DUF4349 domain-containing protein [Caldisericia bacterium]
MKKFVISFVLVSILLLTGCNGFGGENTAQQDIGYDKGAMTKQEAFRDSSSESSNTETSDVETPYPRKIIKNAEISLEVKNPKDISKTIETRVQELDGWVVESNTRGDDVHVNVDLNVRIPASELTPFVDWLKELGKVHYSRIYSDEITLEYYNMQARLENAKKQKEQYLEILKKANTIEEVLQVQSYLDSVQDRIDSGTRQMEVWNLQVDHSMVSISLSQSPQTVKLNEDPTWDIMSLQDVGRRFRNSFVSFFNSFFGFLIELLVQIFSVYLWIALLIWGLWVGIRKLFQIRHRKKTK